MKQLLTEDEKQAWCVSRYEVCLFQNGASVIATFEVNLPYGHISTLENGLYVVWQTPEGRNFTRFGTTQAKERTLFVKRLKATRKEVA